jgi:hypothetical protein
MQLKHFIHPHRKLCICPKTWKLLSSGMWRHVYFVWTDIPPKRRFTQDIPGATSQKTTFFIATAVKTSNFTYSQTVHPLYCTGMAVLVGNNRLSHSISHSLYLLPTSPSVLHHCRARTLELANSRTAYSRTLELSTLELLYPLTDYSLRLTRRILRLSVVFFDSLNFDSLVVFFDTVLLLYSWLSLPPKFLP